MSDEVLTKTDVKLSVRKNVIPITSLSDLGTVVGDIQNQLTLLVGKLHNEVSPEFKALMEGYINKANESEELKVNLENIALKNEEIKTEITQLRETNRTLINELHSAREIMKKLEDELNILQSEFKKNEEKYMEKIKSLTKQNEEYEQKISRTEEEKMQISSEQEDLRQEVLEQNFRHRQSEQELIIQRDNLKKQVEEFDILLQEQQEQIGFKTKEIEYKDALLNQLVKKATTDKLKPQDGFFENTEEDNQKKKRKGWFLGK